MKKDANKGIVLIKKSNDLVESRYKFNIWETRLFLSILSQIRKEDDGFKEYRIWYKDLIKTFDVKSGDSYDLFREAAGELKKKEFHIMYGEEGEKRMKTFNLIRMVDTSIETAGRKEGQEYFDVRIEDDMKPFLLQLQKNFTAYDLRNVIKLGVYSVRLYELLKQYENFGFRKISIESMKTMFGLEDKYPLFADFYRWVIAPSEKEINNNTDILITKIEKIKEGKKTVALRFIFRKKAEDEILELREGEYKGTLFEKQKRKKKVVIQEKGTEQGKKEEQTEKDILFLEFQTIVVGDFGVSPTVFLQELGNFSKEQVEKAIRITKRKKDIGTMKNISGFFLEALRKGYTDEKEIQQVKKVVKENSEKQVQDNKQQLEDLKREEDKALTSYIRSEFSEQPELLQDILILLQSSPIGRMSLSEIDIQKAVFEDLSPLLQGAIKNEFIKLEKDEVALIRMKYEVLRKGIIL